MTDDDEPVKVTRQPPWVRTYRDGVLVMHECDHGVGHPAYGSAHYLSLLLVMQHTCGDSIEPHLAAFMQHACDGCCSDLTWLLDSLTESVQKGNEIIVAQQERLSSLSQRLRQLEDALAEKPITTDGHFPAYKNVRDDYTRLDSKNRQTGVDGDSF